MQWKILEEEESWVVEDRVSEEAFEGVVLGELFVELGVGISAVNSSFGIPQCTDCLTGANGKNWLPGKPSEGLLIWAVASRCKDFLEKVGP